MTITNEVISKNIHLISLDNSRAVGVLVKGTILTLSDDGEDMVRRNKEPVSIEEAINWFENADPRLGQRTLNILKENN